MPDKDEVQDVVDALWQVYHIRDENLGNTEIIRRITEVAQNLAARDTKGTRFGGIRKNVAEAITRSYLTHPWTIYEHQAANRPDGDVTQLEPTWVRRIKRDKIILHEDIAIEDFAHYALRRLHD